MHLRLALPSRQTILRSRGSRRSGTVGTWTSTHSGLRLISASANPRQAVATDPPEASTSGTRPQDSIAEQVELADAAAATWLPGMRRTGVLARKKGMTSLWSAAGARYPVTVLELEDTQVVGHKRPPSDNYYAVQVGCTDRHTSNHLYHSQRKWFENQHVTPKHRVVEFQVDGEDGLAPVGTMISAAHFVPGQYVDVMGTSKGKGFAGVMKKWGFAGGNASHGSTKHHRKAGSTGQHQDPGRVWPGKKMAGRMGADPITVRNLLVARIDTTLNLVFVKGQVPGPTKGFIRVWDARDKARNLSVDWEKKGRGAESGYVLPDVKALPYPCGDEALARTLPTEVTFDVKQA